MRDDLTHVTILLDASSSIKSKGLTDTIREGFNSFFQEQQDIAGEMTVTLYEFSGTPQRKDLADYHDKFLLKDRSTPGAVRRKFQALEVGRVDMLDEENYQPGGMTPLYDAMAQAIDETGERLAATPESQRPGQVVVFTLTDGEDTSSAGGTKQVRERVNHQQDMYDWEFLFVGANMNAVLEGHNLGLDKDQSLTMSHDTDGVSGAISSTSQAFASYREGGTLCYNDTDRSKQDV